jgi:transposase
MLSASWRIMVAPHVDLAVRGILAELLHHTSVPSLSRAMDAASDSHDPNRGLIEIPGIGLVIATAIVATTAGDRRFRSGPHYAAWLGLTPK